jgi:GNAT superfamily N-acetyltransferase
VSEDAAPRPLLRPLVAGDLAEVVRIDALHTGQRKPAWWRRVLGAFLEPGEAGRRIGLGADTGGGLAGYVLGEVRAFEFGSEACGWVFAVGVDPAWLRAGVGAALLSAAHDGFREAGVRTVRTMVRRTDVPVLSFFRSRGYTGGPFVQLEREIAVEAAS